MLKSLRFVALPFRAIRYPIAQYYSVRAAFHEPGCLRIGCTPDRPRCSSESNLRHHFHRNVGTYTTETMSTSPALNTRAHLSPAQIALLPKDKFDDAAIEHISTLSDSEIEPLLPEILTWLQDSNWPIVWVVLPFVLHYPTLITEPVREILRTGDAAWIDVVLRNVVKEMPLAQRNELRIEIERMATEPTEEEKENEVDVDAREILDLMDAEHDEA
jgi:hypothetical protein